MKYSFIKPRTKYLFEQDTKIWIIFFIFTTALLISFQMFLKMKISDSANQMVRNYELEQNLFMEIEKLKAKEEILNANIKIARDIQSNNIVVQSSIKNLFALIPEQITLKKVIVDAKELKLYGVTPSKDVFNFMLEAPLRSIFDESKTNFYMLDSGWYSFESISKSYKRE